MLPDVVEHLLEVLLVCSGPVRKVVVVVRMIEVVQNRKDLHEHLTSRIRFVERFRIFRISLVLNLSKLLSESQHDGIGNAVNRRRLRLTDHQE